MILVPLTSVLYVLALASFSIAAYYGFRLTRLSKKLRIMVMITQDGPQFIVGGIVMLALSQVMKLIESLTQMLIPDFFDVTAGSLMVGSAVMFALGFHRMFAVYMNERLRMSVNNVLEELADKPPFKEGEEKWKDELK